MGVGDVAREAGGEVGVGGLEGPGAGFWGGSLGGGVRLGMVEMGEKREKGEGGVVADLEIVEGECSSRIAWGILAVLGKGLDGWRSRDSIGEST